MRLTLKILGVIVLAFALYVIYWQYQYNRAESEATEFCASVPLGSGISKAIDTLKARSSIRHGFVENETRYIAVFRGPIFNAFTCELEVADSKVTSRRVVEPVD